MGPRTSLPPYHPLWDPPAHYHPTAQVETSKGVPPASLEERASPSDDQVRSGHRGRGPPGGGEEGKARGEETWVTNALPALPTQFHKRRREEDMYPLRYTLIDRRVR